MVVCIWGCMLNLDLSSLESAPIDRCKGMVIYIIAESCKKDAQLHLILHPNLWGSLSGARREMREKLIKDGQLRVPLRGYISFH